MVERDRQPPSHCTRLNYEPLHPRVSWLDRRGLLTPVRDRRLSLSRGLPMGHDLRNLFRKMAGEKGHSLILGLTSASFVIFVSTLLETPQEIFGFFELGSLASKFKLVLTSIFHGLCGEAGLPFLGSR